MANKKVNNGAISKLDRILVHRYTQKSDECRVVASFMYENVEARPSYSNPVVIVDKGGNSFEFLATTSQASIPKLPNWSHEMQIMCTTISMIEPPPKKTHLFLTILINRMINGRLSVNGV